ncbi:hypothetical protein HG536_0E01950 [Torulaspora globosa]|uniref:Vacuolar sorting protein 39/Transforming growth factor beta receptor-associated domain-containing protein n=1 Tax=Torulaspora globosa TaxID=48254 RepID=A0A7G3ZIE8_9SACH|nr:uncharacterized protein HG536_0E01950 [Torulaspora globosa]QLL33284.1 hypothetical protein HG536_0E01950 [Torulaspora globosa]
MLRARLIDSIDSQNVTAVLHSPEARKLLIAKENGDIEVYYREQGKLKLYQAYPKLLQSSQSDETRISGLYESNELSTVFIRCDKSLLLFNSTNLHQYDSIVDRRGIENCWVFEVSLPNNDEKNTFLVYSTRNTGKVRMLIWKGRSYEKIVEATLSKDKEIIKSVIAGNSGILLATDMGVYHWSYGDSVLSRIDKIVRRKYPNDVVRQLAELRSISHSKVDKNDNAMDTLSLLSSSRITKKSSVLNLWSKDRHQTSRSSTLRHLFSPMPSKNVLLDGMTKNLYTLCMTESDLPYMIASDSSQFLDWNSSFSEIQYLSVNLLVLHNSNTIRFVDYENGFTFLEQRIADGIRLFEKIEQCHFIVLTSNDQLQLYRYNVDDGSDDNLGDEESICGLLYDSDFYQLWRKVLFYEFFLESPNALDLCSSDNPEQSLDFCALKLRDLTVMWCLEIWGRLQADMNLLSRNGRIDARSTNLQNLIVTNLFERLTTFWAPPQLIIVRTFPPEVTRLVTEITGQKHDCITSDGSTSGAYTISQELIRESLLPYLVQTRRRLRYMLRTEKMTWDYAGRQVKVEIDFFSLDKHDSLDVSTLLTLVDTVLFITYLHYFPSMVGPLLSVDSMCDYSTVVRELRNRRMFQELVCFYFQRKEHVEALKFLTDLFDDLQKKVDGEKLQDGVKLLVIDYLKKLPKEYQSLVFQYSDWLFARSDSKGNILESIFINDSPTFADRDHYQIYTYIDKHDRQVALEYLEFVISTFKLREVKLHTSLIKRYFEDLENYNTRLKLKSILEITSSYEPRTILRLLQEMTDNDNNMLNKDQKCFLDLLKVYPLQKLGNFEEAVDILYDELSDYNSTSVFCDKVYIKDKMQGQKVLEYLFRKIISSSKGDRKPQIARFVQEHGSKLDVIKIYKLLPDDLLLSDLRQVLAQTIKLHAIENDERRIEKGLFQAELVKKSYELNKSLANFVLLDENYKCPVCRKKFLASSTDSALWYTVDSREVIVHYTCGKALEAKIQAKSAKTKLRSSRIVADLKSAV